MNAHGLIFVEIKRGVGGLEAEQALNILPERQGKSGQAFFTAGLYLRQLHDVEDGVETGDIHLCFQRPYVLHPGTGAAQGLHAAFRRVGIYIHTAGTAGKGDKRVHPGEVENNVAYAAAQEKGKVQSTVAVHGRCKGYFTGYFTGKRFSCGP